MPCPLCAGPGNADCPVCGGRAQWEIRQCPSLEEPQVDLSDVLMCEEDAKHGLWPDAGGWMSQSAQLVQAIRTFWRYRGR